mmetsp:Transcript_23788/g.52360  ORF Transcript_23788/g.52360 Transcript_23788/m.52360 type:complete len:299 (+) Transcript_23788:138-1034(+)
MAVATMTITGLLKDRPGEGCQAFLTIGGIVLTTTHRGLKREPSSGRNSLETLQNLECKKYFVTRRRVTFHKNCVLHVLLVSVYRILNAQTILLEIFVGLHFPTLLLGQACEARNLQYFGSRVDNFNSLNELESYFHIPTRILGCEAQHSQRGIQDCDNRRLLSICINNVHLATLLLSALPDDLLHTLLEVFLCLLRLRLVQGTFGFERLDLGFSGLDINPLGLCISHSLLRFLDRSSIILFLIQTVDCLGQRLGELLTLDILLVLFKFFFCCLDLVGLDFELLRLFDVFRKNTGLPSL